MRYRLDPSVEFLHGGRALLGGDPTKLLRLSEAGAALVARWRREGCDPAGPAERKLVDRLVDAAMAHPVPDLEDRPLPAVVVPVRDRPEALERCLTALVASGATRIIVVDDGSLDPAAHAVVAERHGAAVVRRAISGGPAAARMTGWRALEPRPMLVAFVDSDIEVSPDCWTALVGHVGDVECGLVAPRVAHRAGPGLVDRFEAANSPLDLGPDPAPIRSGTRVSYVPAAALVVRAEAFEEVGGFDEALDVGEDVDLVWRLVEAGWRCRYEPASVVTHVGRSELGPMLRRRFDYGRSAAVLDARHPGALPPVRGASWSAAVVAAVAAGHPVVAAGLTGWTVRALAQRLGEVPDAWKLSARLVLRGHVGFARQLARAVIRPWFPITLALGLVSRRVRRLAAVAALVHPLLTWRDRRPALALPAWVALGLADDMAYSAGVWVGCVAARRLGPLRPEFSRRSPDGPMG